jgi:hypothetical protein
MAGKKKPKKAVATRQATADSTATAASDNDSPHAAAEFTTTIANGQAVPSPVLAAFEAGQMWNRLTWWARQYAISLDDAVRQYVLASAHDLVQKAGATQPNARRSAFQELLADKIRGWETWSSCDAHASALQAANEELLESSRGDGDYDTEHGRICENLLHSVEEFLTALKQAIYEGLEDTPISA